MIIGHGGKCVRRSACLGEELMQIKSQRCERITNHIQKNNKPPNLKENIAHKKLKNEATNNIQKYVP